MSINLLMPALSPTMEEGKIARWLKKEGDNVAIGDVLAEIETDKAVMELEAIEEGVLAKIVVDVAVTTKVNNIIAVLAEEGEEWQKIAKNFSLSSQNSNAVVNVKENIEHKAVVDKVEKQASQPCAQKNNKIFASPLARKLAEQNNIDISNIAGSGPHNRIVKKDIMAYLSSAQAQEKNISYSSKINKQAILALYKEDEYDLVEHSTMRKVIATRLSEAKREIPHFYVTVDCVIDKLLALREELNSSAPLNEEKKPSYRVSVNDMVIKAAANALHKIPQANVSWLDEALIQHKYVNMGVAVAIENGLMTPIVKYAEQKTLLQISSEMKDLIKRAKDLRLKPEEYQGGSACVSNLGMYGVKQFSAIVNPPQSVIFAVSAASKQAIIVNNEIKIANVMSVTISVDHRAVDGAVAAQLIQQFKHNIEHPLLLLI